MPSLMTAAGFLGKEKPLPIQQAISYMSTKEDLNLPAKYRGLVKTLKEDTASSATAAPGRRNFGQEG